MQQIFKYVYIAGVILMTLLFGYTLFGGLLSYHFNIDSIINYHQAFGTDENRISVFDLSRIYKELIFVILLFISIFFSNKKWFFKYLFTILLVRIPIDLIFNQNKIFNLFDEIILNIPLLYVSIFYVVSKKLGKLSEIKDKKS